ncbi:MAG: peptidylprolyl isomerase [Lachnospiraceae bacterium]|nr:peptidylprolyl isomerase [Lachnospiraceae bacterium]
MKKHIDVKKKNPAKGLALLLGICMLVSLCACGGKDSNTKVVLTTGFYSDEVFRIENKSCRLPEVMVYLTTLQNQYEEVYGAQIWQADLDGVTLEENVKEMVLAKIAQIKSLNLLAESMDVKLDAAESEKVKLAAEAYYASLNETEIELMGVTPELIEQLYGEYALAEKVYAHIIRDINPEISDDEARTITVQHILIKTYTTDGRGERVSYSESARAAAYARAAEAYGLATDGNHSFEELIAQYSEDNVASYSFRKGEMTAPFEEAAFNLGTDEISSIVEDEYGYHIIKCLNTFDREETDQNKLKIVEERKKEVFGEEYDAFVDTLTRKLNDEVWENVTFLHDENVTTKNFFDVYEEYFISK